MEDNQAIISFEDNHQKVIVQITRDGDEITVSTTFTPDIDFANPIETPATKWAALFLNTLIKMEDEK